MTSLPEGILCGRCEAFSGGAVFGKGGGMCHRLSLNLRCVGVAGDQTRAIDYVNSVRSIRWISEKHYGSGGKH